MPLLGREELHYLLHQWSEGALLRHAQQVVIFVKNLANTAAEQQQFAPEHEQTVPQFEKKDITKKSIGKELCRFGRISAVFSDQPVSVQSSEHCILKQNLFSSSHSSTKVVN